MPQIFLKPFPREVSQLYMAAGDSLTAVSPCYCILEKHGIATSRQLK